MKKLRKALVIFGIVFFAVIGLLTYFSSTIKYMLLPRISVTYIDGGKLSESSPDESGVYLVPINAITDTGDTAVLFVFHSEDGSIGYVEEVSANIRDKNDMYYEVKMDPIFSSYPVVYETSKDLSSGAQAVLEDS